MSAFLIEVAIITMSVAAIISCFIFVYISQKFGLSAKQIIWFCLCTMSIIPVWAFFGVRSITQLFGIVIAFGLVTGAYQSFQRGLYARLIPASHESEFFSFYQITDKGSAWMGKP